MTDMQTSLPFFAPLDSTAIYPKFGHALLYTTFDRWNKMPYKSYLCLEHSISSSQMLMPHKHQTPSSLLIIFMSQHLAWSSFKWYDPLHIITWPLWFIDLDLAYSLPLPRFIGANSCPRFTASRSIASKPGLALLHFNRSIKPRLVLIFTTLVTWLHVMTHIQ